MKRIIALLVVMLMIFTLGACGKKEEKELTDSEYVIKNGKLIVGITDFAPMDYKDESGKWIGFDADLANMFAESLGVTAEFVEIEWDYKIMTLDSKAIDCVWNGMTLTDEVKTAMETSNAYSDNSQVVVIRKDNIDSIKSTDDLIGLNIVAEGGSAGAAVLTELGINFMENETQTGALMEVAAGTSDAAVIDVLMAAAMTGDGTSYPDLGYTLPLNSELYGVGFRKGSDLAAKLNDFFKEKYADGTMTSLGEKYGIGASIIAQ